MNGKPLTDSTAKDAEIFLSGLNRQGNIKEWQVDQAAGALKLLFNNFLKTQWTPEKSKTQSNSDNISDKSIGTENEKIIRNLKTEIRTRHYSIRTEEAYEQWVRRFVFFHKKKSLEKMNAAEIQKYLEYLAVNRSVAASTQNQALNALVFLYKQVLKREIGEIGEFTRAKRPKLLPVVLTKEEGNRLLSALSGVYALMAKILYGSGLRLMECVRLRVADVDFEQNQIMVRDGKGKKDRVTILPKSLQTPLREHLAQTKIVYEKDIANGRGGVYFWPSLEM